MEEIYYDKERGKYRLGNKYLSCGSRLLILHYGCIEQARVEYLESFGGYHLNILDENQDSIDRIYIQSIDYAREGCIEKFPLNSYRGAIISAEKIARYVMANSEKDSELNEKATLLFYEIIENLNRDLEI